MKQSKLIENNKLSLNKRSIIKSFSRSAKTYDIWAIPQNKVAKHLIHLTDKNTLKGKILDAGCGTGLLTKNLFEIDSHLDIIGIDASQNMIDIYKQINQNVMIDDMESLSFNDNCVDHVFSSFSLHWTNIEKSLFELIRVTSKYLSIALPIKGSLQEFQFPFPDKEYIYSILRKNGIQITKLDTSHVKIPFSGMKLIEYFHYTGSSFNGSKRVGLIKRNSLENYIHQYNNRELYYNILYMTGQK